MSTTTEIDLQIFIGRSSSTSASPYAGLPSFVFLHGRRPASRDTASHHAEDEVMPRGQVEGTNYIVVANSEVVESVSFPFSEEEILTTIRRLETDRLRMQDCVGFGIRLFDFIFHRAVRDLYREVSAKALRGKKGRKLRITIATSTPELAVLPWETMCDTYPRLLPSFLCHQPHIRLVRALRLFNRASFEEGKALGDDEGLRILTVTASPPGTSPIDVSMDEKILNFIIGKSPMLERVQLEVCRDATIVSLRKHLYAFRPHIVHLACHAGYDVNEDLGFVALNSSKEEQAAEHVNAYRLATLMQGVADIQLVFANTCLGARQQASSSFSGVAQCLHAMGIPTVVALQFQLTDRTAHAIVLNFYEYLLRDGLPVEDAVGHLRRQMFIDGYMAPETFGLTLFQTNATLAWPVKQPNQIFKVHPEAEQFTNIFEQFELNLKRHIQREIQQEASVPGWHVDDLQLEIEGLPASYLTSAHEALGFWSVAILLPRRLPAFLGISAEDEDKAESEFLLTLSGLVVRTAKLALQMAATRFESQSFQTALVVTTEDGLHAYKSQYQLDASTTTETSNLLGVGIKEVLKLALKVDGERRALMLVVNPQNRMIRTVVQSLIHIENNDAPAFSKATRRWAAVQRYAQQAGCAFLLPGGGRVKLILEGEQVLEFRDGKWFPADLRELRRSVIELAKETGLEEAVLIDVFEKCLFAAEEPKSIGKAIIVQRTDSVLRKGVARGFNPAQDLLRELRDKPITEFSAQDYLKGGAGDNAIVISSQGYTLAVNVPLASAKAVESVAGTGARHRSAQEVTKRTDALAIVVSEDRPITVFLGGKVKFTYPPSAKLASVVHPSAE
jgi:hypothetical protein